MTTDIKINSLGELVIENNDLVLVSGIDAMLQRITRKLKFIINDWFINSSKGLDYSGLVLVKNPNLNYIDNMIIVTVTDDPEIIRMIEYKSELLNNNNARKLRVKFKAQSVYGVAPFEGVV